MPFYHDWSLGCSKHFVLTIVRASLGNRYTMQRRCQGQFDFGLRRTNQNRMDLSIVDKAWRMQKREDGFGAHDTSRTFISILVTTPTRWPKTPAFQPFVMDLREANS